MSDKPRIYGTCPAGCLWETVHKNDFLNSASIFSLPKNADGTFTLEEGKKYKILSNGTGGAITGDGVWDAEIYIKAEYEYGSYTETATGTLSEISGYDKFNFDGIAFRFCGCDTKVIGVDTQLIGVCYLGNTRHDVLIATEGASIAAKKTEITVRNATAVYLINEDAHIELIDNLPDVLEDVEKSIGGFVTPQIYGAVGDGEHDDTEAIQRAIMEHDNVHIPDGIYKISKSIIVETANAFYNTNGYLGKNITGDNAKFVMTYNEPCFIVRGYHNHLKNIVCCFAVSGLKERYLNEETGVVDERSVNYPTSALIELQSLVDNVSIMDGVRPVRQCCNNTFENIRCVSIKNVYDEHAASRNVYGIGIRVVSDDEKYIDPVDGKEKWRMPATYQNKFIGCNCADLYKGIVIENGSHAGINSNYFGVDLWNCSYLFEGNGDGNTFDGTNQAPWVRFVEPADSPLDDAYKSTAEENVCFKVSGNYNTFNGFTWDCGAYDKNDDSVNKNTAPFLDVSGVGNVFTSPCYAGACKGNLEKNKITTFSVPSANQTPYVTNTPLAMRGEGGYPMLYAPLSNSLNHSDVKISLDTANVVIAETPNPYAYTELNASGIPTNINALAGLDYAKRPLVFTTHEDARLRLEIELPPYFPDLEALFIYTTQHRMIPKRIEVRTSNMYFGFEPPEDYIMLGSVPTKNTVGEVGELYKYNGVGYKCAKYDAATGEYTWNREITRTKTFTYDDPRIVDDKLGCFSLNLDNKSEAGDNYITVDIELPRNVTRNGEIVEGFGKFGLSYIAGVATSKTKGPIVEEDARVIALENTTSTQGDKLSNLTTWCYSLDSQMKQLVGGAPDNPDTPVDEAKGRIPTLEEASNDHETRITALEAGGGGGAVEKRAISVDLRLAFICDVNPITQTDNRKLKSISGFIRLFKREEFDYYYKPFSPIIKNNGVFAFNGNIEFKAYPKNGDGTVNWEGTPTTIYACTGAIEIQDNILYIWTPTTGGTEYNLDDATITTDLVLGYGIQEV